MKDTTRESAERAAEAEELLTTIAKRGRAAGVVFLLSTQKATADSLGSGLRDQLAERISDQQLPREASRAALGELTDGLPLPHEISAQSPGRAFGVGMVDQPDLVSSVLCA